MCEFGVVITTLNSHTPDRFQAWQSCRWAAAPDVTTERRHDAGTATEREPDRDCEVVRKPLFCFLWSKRSGNPWDHKTISLRDRHFRLASPRVSERLPSGIAGVYIQ